MQNRVAYAVSPGHHLRQSDYAARMHRTPGACLHKVINLGSMSIYQHNKPGNMQSMYFGTPPLQAGNILHSVLESSPELALTPAARNIMTPRAQITCSFAILEMPGYRGASVCWYGYLLEGMRSYTCEWCLTQALQAVRGACLSLWCVTSEPFRLDTLQVYEIGPVSLALLPLMHNIPFCI